MLRLFLLLLSMIPLLSAPAQPLKPASAGLRAVLEKQYVIHDDHGRLSMCLVEGSGAPNKTAYQHLPVTLLTRWEPGRTRLWVMRPTDRLFLALTRTTITISGNGDDYLQASCATEKGRTVISVDDGASAVHYLHDGKTCRLSVKSAALSAALEGRDLHAIAGQQPQAVAVFRRLVATHVLRVPPTVNCLETTENLVRMLKGGEDPSAKLLAELRSPRYKRREAANRALAELLARDVRALLRARAALAEPPTLEFKQRLAPLVQDSPLRALAALIEARQLPRHLRHLIAVGQRHPEHAEVIRATLERLTGHRARDFAAWASWEQANRQRLRWSEAAGRYLLEE